MTQFGVGVTYETSQLISRELPSGVRAKPYFYFENMAIAPTGVWQKFEPEFVDSKCFCAAMSKRGYIHNLPIDNRSPCFLSHH